ncbi:uncharacterized protein KY384_004442 [Bacidia gigantensis]|uniref:uncharacterized protein n=1 Tax=Bacidia gigantensis TaxID=2732470 RepID=UPI001D056395|nr:uncharacterized protein KY384_004442 [Bacidia gigantensis]KAG8531085.1 hypothetical protein KY384_004442 [Bacidia gigantensis]
MAWSAACDSIQPLTPVATDASSTASGESPLRSSDTSFDQRPHSFPKSSGDGSLSHILESPTYDFLLPAENYIPVGTLVIKGVFYDEWTLIDPRETDRVFDKKEPVAQLIKNEWVRAVCRRNYVDEERSSVRIFALTDDVGRRRVDRTDRPLQKRMEQTLKCLDISTKAWEATKPLDAPCRSLDFQSRSDEETCSLFYLFNTIPSPDATSLVVSCPASQDAIDSLFEPNGLKPLITQLYPYQKRTAATMIRREVQPRTTPDPRYAQIIGPMENTILYDYQTGKILKKLNVYEDVKGGVVAESMGFGKTLISLSVILATKGHWPAIPPQYSCGLHPVRPTTGSLLQMTASAISHAQIPWKPFLDDLSRSGEDHQACLSILEENVGRYEIPPPPKRHHFRQANQKPSKYFQLCSATIIVVPRNLLSQWQREIAQHFDPGTFNILCLDTKEDVMMPAASQLLPYDIILLTRPRFEQEMSPSLTVNCTCPSHRRCHCTADIDYHSPLRDLHFLRIIMDEGHEFATGTNRVCQALSELTVERKWLLSGTPSRGLLGVEVDTAAYETSKTSSSTSTQMLLEARKRNPALDQEKKDLANLGLLVTKFFKVKPWANSSKEDSANWTSYIIPDKQGRRKPTSLRNLLDSLFLRHRIEDIEAEVPLPPLLNQIAYVEPKWQDKLSQNAFLISLIANAVTSEREDSDYMHHQKNRPALHQLINNLRQSCFYWTGFSVEEISKTLEISRKYLEGHREHAALNEDRTNFDHALLHQAIECGEIMLSSHSWKAFSVLHELGIYVDNFPLEGRESWSLVPRMPSDPLLIGATQLCKAQTWVDKNIYRDGAKLLEDLSNMGQVSMLNAWQTSQNAKEKRNEKMLSEQPKSTKQGQNKTSKKPQRNENKRTPAQYSSGQPKISDRLTLSKAKASLSPVKIKDLGRAQIDSGNGLVNSQPPMKSALKPSKPVAVPPSDSHIFYSSLRGTASAKLSYLLDKVIATYKQEKILVFYEGDHIAYYIAQAFDLIGVRYLIYTQTLDLALKSAYIATFNTAPTFRVMLMNIKEAAHGLHIASASRVFFVNPIWQPNVEAQAIKRAHRIGQTRPVYVETIVLKGTLEDQMLQRRKNMTVQEHKKAENSLLDDEPMTAIIKNASLLPLSPSEIHHVEKQVAELKTPIKLFGQARKNGIDPDNPYADLIFPMETKKTIKLGIKKTEGSALEALLQEAEDDASDSDEFKAAPHGQKRKRTDNADSCLPASSQWMCMDKDVVKSIKPKAANTPVGPQNSSDSMTASEGSTNGHANQNGLEDAHDCSKPSKKKRVGFASDV